MKTIYFIRHGETDSNRTRAQQSGTEPLNTVGFRQAATVAERMKHLPVERLIASSMTRAQQTGQAVADAIGIPCESSDLLRELAIPSALEGALSSDDPEAAVNQYLRAREEYAADPHYRYEDGENFQDILERVSATLTFLAEQPESHIAVVSHGRFLRTLGGWVVTGGACSAADVTTFSYTLKAANTGVTVLQYEHEQWKLLTWNDMTHLAE